MTIGTNGPDTLTGGAGSDLLEGLAGDDRLDGAGGVDETRGGPGDDLHFVDHSSDLVVEAAGEGVDSVYARASFVLGANVEHLVLRGSDPINGTGNNLANTITGNSAANVLNGGTGADKLKGGAANDTYYVDNASDQVVEVSGGGIDLVYSTVSFALTGEAENLTLTGTGAINGTGNALANTLVGNSAANRINGGAGADEMRGGAGDDSYVVENVADVVVEGSGNGTDLITSSVSYTLGAYQENLTLTGLSAIDGTGNGLANLLIGSKGANVLNGGAGADAMRGGAGDDIYVVDNAGDTVVEGSNRGTDTVQSSVSFVLGAHVEKLILTGAGAINGTGNGLANQLTGNAAANSLDGGIGADTMTGAGGNDTYFVDNTGDTAIETSGSGGTDLVRSSVTFVLGANIENLILTGVAAINGTGNGLANQITGNAAANQLDGGTGDDTLNGGSGADTLNGGAGNDTYFVDNAADLVIESSPTGGTDTVNSSVGLTLGANLENLILTGAGAIGGIGNGLANSITGNSGANLLNGGAGHDVLTSGSGSDIFEFTASPIAANSDTIADFDIAQDKIRLAGAAGQAFASLATGDLWEDAFQIGSAATDVFDRIIYNDATGDLLYDADGVGGVAAVQFATLESGLALSAEDFVVSGTPNVWPQITSGDSAVTAENVAVSTIVYQVQVQETDGDTVAYALHGLDAASFTIDQTGAVRFVASPDFETKSSYQFVVDAIDSAGQNDLKGVTISITNVNENSGPYQVSETAANNDSRFSAQPLDRDQFTVADSPNVPNDSLPTAIITGNVSTPGDKDFFSITLQAGELLVLDIDGTDTLDAWVTVYDASGNIVTFNDDPGGPFDPGSTPHPGVGHNMDSVVRVRAPADGTYYVSVESFFDESGPSSDGEYTLNVSIGPVATAEEINQENIQALISGDVWSDPDLTYGFTQDQFDYGPGEAETELEAGMSQLNATQRAAVNTILPQFASLTDLTFTQLSANPGDAQLRYALSNDPETAHAYSPGPGDGGDSWYNTTEYTNPRIGNYEWMAFVHETGHALGLKHGHESPALTPDRDSLEFSVMTYRSYTGAPVDDENGGYTNETWGYPQTLMMYDIAALQQMYGADFTHRSGDTVYSWSPSTGALMINGAVQWTPGANRVFMTLWDGDGEDTYDLSNYSTNVTIDLRPGEWTRTSTIQLANLGDGNMARGNVANALLFEGDERSLIENAIGGSSSDFIVANQAANQLTGGGGGDTFRWVSAGDAGIGVLADRVMDFDTNESDQISLTSIDANPATAGDDAFTFIGNSAFTSTPGQLRYQVIDGDAHILADLDGNGVADMQIILNDVTFIGGAEINF